MRGEPPHGIVRMSAILAMAVGLPLASAQTQDDDEARQASAQALEAFNAKDYARARDLYIRVVSLKPSADSFWALARCYEELGDLEKALAYLVRAEENNPSPARKQKIEEKRAALRTLLDTPVAIPVTCDPKDADVSVDDSPAAPCPPEVRLRPGAHAFVAVKPGFRETRKTLSIRPGSREGIALRLEPVPAIPVALPAVPADRPGVFQKWWFWTVIGTVVAGGVVATVVSLKMREGKTVPQRWDGTWSGIP